MKPFYSHRNIRQCLGDGISLFSDNFRSILRMLWPVVLVCSLLTVGLIWLSLLQMEWTLSNPSLHIAAIVAAVVLSLIVECIFITHVYTIVKLHASAYELPQVKTLFFYSVAGKLMKRSFGWYALFTPFVCVLNVIAAIITLPVMPALILSEKSFWSAVRYGLRLSFRNIWREIGMFLLLCLSVGILLVLLLAPAIASVLMIQAAEASRMAGDVATAMSLSQGLMISAMMFVSAAVTLFFQTIYYFPIAYFYSSILVKYEKELADS